MNYLCYALKQLPIDYGVPHGSVLGPLLLIIYTNDIPNSLKHCNDIAILFAEDMNRCDIYLNL